MLFMGNYTFKNQVIMMELENIILLKNNLPTIATSKIHVSNMNIVFYGSSVI